METVNHPSHYNRENAIECIEEMELIFGTEAVMTFCLLNAWKYRYRAADKNGSNDLKKSDWYMNKYKELKEKQENKSNDPNKYTITIPYQPNNNNGIVTVPCHKEHPIDRDWYNWWYNQPICITAGQN